MSAVIPTTRGRNNRRRSRLSGALLLAGLAMPAAAQDLPMPNDAVVRLAGANIVGVGLVPPLASGWTKALHLPALRTEQGSDPLAFILATEGAEGARKLRLDVRFHGTSTGLEPLARGAADFWMADRQAREADLEAMRRRGVPGIVPLAQFLAPGAEHVIALDAIAIVVHPSNPVRKLSMAQLRDIFTGRLINWSQVGGPSQPISIYAADPSFGTFERGCTTLVGAPTAQQCVQQMARLAAPHFKSVEDLSDAVAGDPTGIGWVGLVARRGARAMPIATECGGISAPDPFAVQAEEYPLASRYYLYTLPGRPMGAAAQNFLNFAIGPDGQAALGAGGAVDLRPSLASDTYAAERLDNAGNALDGGQTRIRPADLRAFEDATQNANRLSITLRFLEGTNNLDARAEADLGRLAALMKGAEHANSQLVLIGFSAARGDYASNRNLSRQRAEAARDRLVNTMGVKNAIALGVGPTAPVACNTEGSTMSTMNQRVEAWIRKMPGG